MHLPVVRGRAGGLPPQASVPFECPAPTWCSGEKVVKGAGTSRKTPFWKEERNGDGAPCSRERRRHGLAHRGQRHWPEEERTGILLHLRPSRDQFRLPSDLKLEWKRLFEQVLAGEGRGQRPRGGP